MAETPGPSVNLTAPVIGNILPCSRIALWVRRRRRRLQRKERLTRVHCSLRSLRLALRASLAPCGGARFPTLAGRSQIRPLFPRTPRLTAWLTRVRSIEGAITKTDPSLS